MAHTATNSADLLIVRLTLLEESWPGVVCSIWLS